MLGDFKSSPGSLHADVLDVRHAGAGADLQLKVADLRDPRFPQDHAGAGGLRSGDRIAALATGPGAVALFQTVRFLVDEVRVGPIACEGQRHAFAFQPGIGARKRGHSFGHRPRSGGEPPVEASGGLAGRVETQVKLCLQCEPRSPRIA